MDRGSSSNCSQPEKRKKSKHEAKQLNDSLFELYKPPGKRNVQIVFFHGFQLGRYEDAHLSTWESRDGGFLWPQTWLVEEFPHAHILTIGYNARVTKRNGDGNLDLHIIGENLMSDLINIENVGQDPRCPLILVGHSFGGIVIKQLCAHARKRGHPSHERFLENLKGVFFYSTPHHGGEFLTFAPFFMSKSLLLKHVEILSTSASRLNDDFENLRNVHYKHWQIEALGESQPTEWGNSKSVVVQEASSRYGNNYQTVEDANHMTVCQPKEKTSRAFNSLTNLVSSVISISKVSSAIHETQGLPDFSSGLERRVEDVKNILKVSTVVGIVGMGGVGKTTIAKKIFNEISNEYEYTCFVDNAKGFSTHALNEYLLSSFYRYGTKVKRDDMQLSLLKEKKTLIVMDDIDKEDQLNHLPNSDHFGDGSHLLITTRDRGVFDRYPDCPFYDVDLLDNDEARKLLCHHVFGLDNIPTRLEKCVDEALKKCEGLPLTLEVTGRYLRSHKNDVRFWEQTIKKLGAAQSIDGKKDNRVWPSLRVSYDGLEKEEQEMFVEAGTCFFEQPLEEALAAWSTSNGAVENTWDNLLRRSLVKEARGGKIWVHEHLRDLAKEVSQRHEVATHDVQTFEFPNSSDPILIRYEFPGEPMKCWLNRRVTKTEDSRDLDIDMRRIEPLLISVEDPTTIQLETLENMENLKYLDLCNLLPRGSSKNFPRNVSLLMWTISPVHSKHLGIKFRYPELPEIKWKVMHKLGVLRLAGWKISTELLEALGNLINLRTLYLAHLEGFYFLSEEIRKLSCLKRLHLSNLSLSTLPSSFGDLSALKHLTLRELQILELPKSFGRLSSLEELSLEYCTDLQRLPNTFGQLTALKKLSIKYADQLEELCDNFGLLSGLEELCLESCNRLQRLPNTFGQLTALRKLSIEHADQLEELCDNFGLLSGLEELELKSCKRLQRLPNTFGQLTALKKLSIKYADQLEELCKNFGLLSGLEELCLESCNRLQRLPNTSGQLTALRKLSIEHADQLEELCDNFGLLSGLEELQLKYCKRLQRLPNTFGQLAALKKLTIMDAAELKELCDNFGLLSGLEELQLNSCRGLQKLPNTFGQLTALKELSIEDADQLEELCDNFGLLSGLEELRLSCERLQRLPNTFGQLTALKKLSIKDADQLEELCDNFGLLSGLGVFRLKSCKRLQRFPNTFGQLTALKELSIEDADQLEELWDNFGLLSGLEELQLLYCKRLQTLPNTFGQLTSLKKLTICDTDQVLEELCDNFGLLSGLEELQLWSCKRLQRLPNTFGQLTALRKLSIKDADEFKELCDNFGLLSGLEELCLESCKRLQTLPNTFGQLTALKKLTIHKADQLEELCDNFGRLSGLKELKLESCKRLQRLPNTFGQLTALKKLSIQDADELKELCDNFGLLPGLESLWLHSCKSLQRLPNTFGQLTALKRLIIENVDQLEELCDNFGLLSGLKVLELKSCKRLQRLPNTFGQLTALKTLSIQDADQLEELCDNFGLLSGLESLRLHSCKSLQRLPNTFGQLTALKKLIIKNVDQLEELCDNFGLLSGLEELELKSCKRLQRLPNTFGQLTALKKLWIEAVDQLEELCDNFGLLSGLESLRLSCKRLQRLPNTFGKLTALEKLSIGHADQLEELCDNFGLLSGLEELELFFCRHLQRLPNTFGHLTALKKLSIFCADHLEMLSDNIGHISSLRELYLVACNRLKSLPDSLGKPLSSERDRASASPIKGDCFEASGPQVNRVLHKRIRCDGCNIFPIEGSRFKSQKKPDFDLCSDCFGKADDQVDYVHIQPLDLNGLRVYITKCHFLDETALSVLGWVMTADESKMSLFESSCYQKNGSIAVGRATRTVSCCGFINKISHFQKKIKMAR